MAQNDIRKFVFQNPSSGNTYEAALLRNSDGSVSGVGRQIGTNGAQRINSDPEFDNTEITFVVLTSALAATLGPDRTIKTDSYLSQAAIYHATNPAGTGAALSTLLT